MLSLKMTSSPRISYFFCGFNGFKQFDQIAINENRNISVKETLHDGPNSNGHHTSGTDGCGNKKTEGNLSFLSFLHPALLSTTSDIMFSWSTLFVFDEQSSNFKTYGFNTSSEKSFEHYFVDQEDGLGKLEYPDCARGFTSLPLNDVANLENWNCCFAIKEDNKVLRLSKNDVDSRNDTCETDSKVQITEYRLSTATEIESVSCGKEHTLSLSTTGKVFSFGLGSRGQLGTGSLESHQDPVVVDALQAITVVQICAGGWHSLALSSTGDVYSWGWNESGQLGFGCVEDDPESKIYDYTYNCQAKEVCHRPMFSFLPDIVNFKEDIEIQSVSCGSKHSAAVAADSSVWTWGWNGYGQLGHGDRVDRHCPTKISTFDYGNMLNCDVLCNAWNTLIRISR